MRTAMRLTIQDYFQRRLAAGGQSKASGRSICGPAAGAPSFSKVLSATRASSNPRGLSIQDYLQRRIPSLSPHADGRTASAVVPRTPAPVPVNITQSGQLAADAPDTSVGPPAVVQEDQEKPPVEDHQRIVSSIHKAAARYRLSPALINAVIKAESAYQVRAVSRAGAQGLMQLMPGTAREMGVVDPFDIEQNIDGGAQYLRKMLDQFDGDVHLALSAYNAGPGTVARYGGEVPYAETRSYVQRVLRYAEEYPTPGLT